MIGARLKLVLLRHGKSDWSGGEPDVRRPLAKRGRDGASEISSALRNDDAWAPALVLTSRAVRARETVSEMGLSAPVVLVDGLYEAATDDGTGAAVVRALREALDSVEVREAATVLAVGHNPGWDEAAAELSGACVEEIALKTANAALLETIDEHTSWKDALSIPESGQQSLWRLAEVRRLHRQREKA
mmetsp:Transcript_20441/g.66380  ORF Transcript_20441/g.66380 Transcript_20441/m.66380 type:complete len:188 (+) Transcript_20441:3-566(+)